VLGYYWDGGGNVSNPERLLTNLKILHKLYISGNYEETPTGWMYIYTRTLYLTGKILETSYLLKQLTQRKLTFMLWLKVYFMLANSYCRKYKAKFAGFAKF